MLDVRTIFVVMIVTSFVLAASLWITVGPRFRNGLGKWTAALAVQSAMFALFAARGQVPDWLSVIVSNALFSLTLSLMAAAILEFYQRSLSPWWHVLPPLLVAVLYALMQHSYATRVLVSGVLFGGGLLGLALLLQRFHHGERHAARTLMMAGFMLGGAALVVRALMAIIDPSTVSSLLAPGWFQAMVFLAGNAVILIISVGFLVLHMEAAEESAKKLAVVDPLTGTFNRRTFVELAQKEISRARRSQTPLSMIMFDLDHFKRINDQHGHLTGDDVLKNFAAIVKESLRREDLLVRYGGEEFCVLLPDVPVESAFHLAERIRDAVRRTPFRARKSSTRLIAVTVSAGVACLREEDGNDIAGLIGRSDDALYTAKDTGRNRVVTFPENSTIAALTRSQRLTAIAVADTGGDGRR